MSRKIILALFLGLLVSVGVSNYAQGSYKELKDEVLRFHVVANSNSEQDQAVKLLVRDAVIGRFCGLFSYDSKEEAMENIEKNLQSIEDCANETLRENGFSYHAAAIVNTRYFPTKDYDGFSFPAGEYEALSIRLGEAKGDNWWCVCYPSLCFGAVQDADDCVEIGLSDQSAKLITAKEENNVEYEVKFKLIEIINEWNK